MTNQFDNITNVQVATFIKELVAIRCQNYGYDYKAFKRISSQRSRARKALLKFANTHGLKAVGQLLMSESRVTVETVKVVQENQMPVFESRLSYVVGQSQNEEITNLMRRIAYGSKAKWLN
jgi:hypothetical protein